MYLSKGTGKHEYLYMMKYYPFLNTKLVITALKYVRDLKYGLLSKVNQSGKTHPVQYTLLEIKE